jgi:hypothetical protein
MFHAGHDISETWEGVEDIADKEILVQVLVGEECIHWRFLFLLKAQIQIRSFRNRH